MTTSAVMWRRPTVTWKRRQSTTSLVRTPSSSIASARRQPRTMATVRKRLFVRELQSKIAITSLERSKWRCARPMSTGTARSFPISSPSPPVEKQNCHFEPKKICELEMKTRPKKAKKYSYTKDCKEQPREICDQCEKKKK